MEKAVGIGGLFFKTRNPELLAQWFKQRLNISLTPSTYDELPWLQEGGPTVFNPFPENTKYFGNSEQRWMVNFRIRDLNAMLKQLQDAGINVIIDPKVYPNGRCARLDDPENNPVELWQPIGNFTQH